jgi:class 3 adenylate cyclase
LLGRARRAAGDETGAEFELEAALAGFRRLDAAPAIREVEGLLRVGQPEAARRMRTFMFTDIVGSTELVGLIGDEAWNDLRGWHDRTLKAEFESHRGEVVSHTGDGFFIAFDGPDQAVECAIAVQRRLREHRKQHGFAPWVRIGIHSAEATHVDDNYFGQGVHVAARVSALAGRDEIVVSAETVADLAQGRWAISEPRQAKVKGVAEPVTVHLVEWVE